jgi:hypothetical protein
VLDIVAADQDEPSPAVDVRLVNDGKSGLAPAHSAAGQPLPAEAAKKPQGQRQDTEHHDEEEQQLERIRSLAEQGVEHHYIPLPQGMASVFARMVNAPALSADPNTNPTK